MVDEITGYLDRNVKCKISNPVWVPAGTLSLGTLSPGTHTGYIYILVQLCSIYAVVYNISENIGQFEL